MDVVRISARPRLFPDLSEAWRYRWMAIALSRRGLMTRYTQTMLGPSWFMIQPLMLTGILTLVMGAILRLHQTIFPTSSSRFGCGTLDLLQPFASGDQHVARRQRLDIQ